MEQGERDWTTAARGWALAMTAHPSVTSSKGEIDFAPWLAARLEDRFAFATAKSIWTGEVAPGDPRRYVAMLLRGRGRRTVILTGHFDTVSETDYGELKTLAFCPLELRSALLGKLASSASTPAERRALVDLQSGDFLPGRGLLDMKAGLAAGLAAAEAVLRAGGFRGNVLFLAVPDEENASIGARAVARDLGPIAEENDLDIIAAINLDSIADDTDGRHGRVIATGTIGKLLPTAFIVGVPAHSGFPLNGLNAAAIAASIASELEWAPELTDGSVPDGGTPPSLLSLRDGKEAYDVTTPQTAFLALNVLLRTSTPAQVTEAFEILCRRGCDRAVERLKANIERLSASVDLPPIQLHRFAVVKSAALAARPAFAGELAALVDAVSSAGLPLPEQGRRVADAVWQASGLSAPVVVLGFGSIPYVPTALSHSPEGRRLAASARRVAEAASARHGSIVSCTDYFAGISDLSFFGEADRSTLDAVAANTPMWRDDWSPGPRYRGIPSINMGPWGRDYHTPLERLHCGYAFEVLPGMLIDLLRDLCASE
ncbi:MAG: M20/M25/M40 family metallo-hydrolase [Hyphomicrobiales bacterium]